LPDPGSYNPESGMFTSFGKLLVKNKDANKESGGIKKNVFFTWK